MKRAMANPTKGAVNAFASSIRQMKNKLYTYEFSGANIACTRS